MKVPFSRKRPNDAPPPEVSPSGAEAIDDTAVHAAVSPPAAVAPAEQPNLDPPPPPEDEQPRGNRPALRRRLRFLRRAHELGLRDLGGLVFDLHRFGRRNDQLVAGKLQALDVIDREMRAIESLLGAGRDVIELREPGITACARCGGLHGTDARFCPACGTEIGGPVAVSVAHSPAPDVTAAQPVATTPAAAAVDASAPAPVPQPPAVPTPPVPSSGPAPAAPPLWSVPQPQADKPDATDGDAASADPAS